MTPAPILRIGIASAPNTNPSWQHGDAWQVSRAVYAGQVGRIAVKGIVESQGGGFRISIQLTNASLNSCALSRASLAWELPLGDAKSAAALQIAYCGAHSRSQMSRSFVTELHDDETAESWWVGALASSTGAGAVLGALDLTTFVSSVRLSRVAAEISMYLEGWVLQPGESLHLPALWLGRTNSAPFEALESFATLVGRAHGFVPRHPACGWGSWGHFLERIDAGVMRETLLAIDGTISLRDVIGVVQIDDGWSELLDSGRVSASWRANRRFESGIAPLAAVIRHARMDCGLWILPFTVNEGSDLAENHPDYLVRNEAGEPFRVGGGSSYCVDPTHPGGREWLRDVFSQIHGWGVRYVKLDFLRALLAPDPSVRADNFEVRRRYHSARTRLQAYREGLRVIREAMGAEAYLVGCSAPTAAGVGLVDAHRVGPDIEPEWEGRYSGIREAVTSIAANWFWQGRAWVNDPDYLMTGASEAESRFWATAVALSGGSVVISADLPSVAPWQERLFSLVTPPTGRAARPLDLFENFTGPRLWRLDYDGPTGAWTLLGLFNWRDGPCELVVNFAELGLPDAMHVWNVWRGRHQVGESQIILPLEAHDAALLALRPAADRPQVVGSDMHFAQGAVLLDEERWEDGRLHLRAVAGLPRIGSVYVFVPTSGELRSVPLAPGAAVTLEFPMQAAAEQHHGLEKKPH